MLVPSPTPSLCAQLRALLARHNPLEDGVEGLYAICDGTVPKLMLLGAKLFVMPQELRRRDVPNDGSQTPSKCALVPGGGNTVDRAPKKFR